MCVRLPSESAWYRTQPIDEKRLAVINSGKEWLVFVNRPAARGDLLLNRGA